MTALETVKSECNAEANREGKPLSAYNLKVSLPNVKGMARPESSQPTK